MQEHKPLHHGWVYNFMVSWSNDDMGQKHIIAQ